MRSQKKMKRQHPLHWLVEPLMEEPDLLEKPMFGCHACYLHGRLSLVLASGDEPWNGLLVPTEREFHDSIMADFRDLVQHPVLKKWLYLSHSTEDFETTGTAIVEAVRLNDPRFGVEPRERISGKKRKS
jgi:hypothetical protein